MGSIKKIYQSRKPTNFLTRKSENNKLNVNKTIKEQVDSMRSAETKRHICCFNLRCNFCQLIILKLNDFI